MNIQVPLRDHRVAVPRHQRAADQVHQGTAATSTAPRSSPSTRRSTSSGTGGRTLLHNHKARRIRHKLMLVHGVTIALVPWLLDSSDAHLRPPLAAAARSGPPRRAAPSRAAAPHAARRPEGGPRGARAARTGDPMRTPTKSAAEKAAAKAAARSSAPKAEKVGAAAGKSRRRTDDHHEADQTGMTLVAVVLGGILGTGLRLTIDALVAPDERVPVGDPAHQRGRVVRLGLPGRAGLAIGSRLAAGRTRNRTARVVHDVLGRDRRPADPHRRRDDRCSRSVYLVASLVLGCAAALARDPPRRARRRSTPPIGGGRVSALVVVVALLAGALGALLRYGTTVLFARRADRLPWAVLVVNTVGSLIGGVVLGLVTTGAVGSDVQLIVMGGLAGGLTTFSTFSVETVQLALAGRWRAAVASVSANLVVGIALAVAGFALAGGFG